MISASEFGWDTLPETSSDSLWEDSRGRSVAIMRLIDDILHLPADQMAARIFWAGYDLHTIQCVAVTREWTPDIEDDTAKTQLFTFEATLNSLWNQNDLEMLVWFSRELSLHSSRAQNTEAQYQKYFELLLRIAPLLPERLWAQITSLVYFPKTTREAKLEYLAKRWLLPNQLISNILKYSVEKWEAHLSPSEELAFSGIKSYKNFFQGLLSRWWTPPQSEKTDITSEEHLIYIRHILENSLIFLKHYLSTTEVWTFLKITLWEVFMKWFFDSYDALEWGFRKRIDSHNLAELKPRDFTLFYESYISLVENITQAWATPDNLKLRSLWGLKVEI